ncbi:MAG: polysaccharide deacetylase family protein [Microbacterium sp.]
MTLQLCFHGIGTIEQEREPGEARYWVTESVFLGILDRLTGHADVALSFDDGNRSDVDIALPALTARGLDATFFALAGRLQDSRSLGGDDLRLLRTSGMRVGTHGWEHIPWRGLSENEAQRELVDARDLLQEVSGGGIDQAALPLGRYDRQLLRRLKRAKYRTVFTSDRFPARDSAWLQARYSVTATDTPGSVAALLDRRVGLGDAVQLGKSIVKRML